MICPNQSNRGPLKKKKKEKEELKCGSLPTADIVGAVGKKNEKNKNKKYDQKIKMNLLLAHTLLHIPLCGIFFVTNDLFYQIFVNKDLLGQKFCSSCRVVGVCKN